MKLDRKLERNLGVLKDTSRNGAKRLKTRATTWARKTTEAIVKQPDTIELQIQKA